MIPRVPVKVRCDRLRVPAETTDPIVQIIDGNKQNVIRLAIGLLGSHGASMQGHEPSNNHQKENAAMVCHTFFSVLLELGNTFFIFNYVEHLPLVTSTLIAT
jgi:hypothetical protein